MKILRFASCTLLLLPLGFCSLRAAPIEQTPVTAAAATPADLDWKRVEAVMKEPAFYRRGNDAEAMKAKEDAARRFRERGLEFWTKYPEDRRRYEWLSITVTSAPRYLVDPAQAAAALAAGDRRAVRTDAVAAAEWQRRFENELRPAYLEKSGKSARERAGFVLRITQNAYYNGEAGDVSDVIGAIEAYAASGEASDQDIEFFGGLVAALPHSLPAGDVVAAETKIFRALAASNSPTLRLVGSGRQLLASFKTRPFTLAGTALDGRSVDLARMRDKIVFVDMWATSCSGCIAAMPHIKEVYEKYRDQGFEVVGVCFNSEEDRAEVERLMAKMSIPWPQLLQGRTYGPKKSKLWQELGLSGVPVTLLLGHDGTVITNDLGGDKLEVEVRRALGLPPQK